MALGAHPASDAGGTHHHPQGRRAWRVALAASLPASAVLAILPIHLDGVPPAAPLVAAVVTFAPLLWMFRRPVAAMWAVTVLSAGYAAAVPLLADSVDALTVASFMPVPVAAALAAGEIGYSLGTVRAWVHGGVAALLIAGASTATAGLVHNGHQVLLVNTVVLGVGVGQAWRARAGRFERLAADRRALTAQAVADERLRIARDLHDALAHRLTLVNAQAGVAEYLAASSPEAAREALAGIAEHTSAALDELRATLGVLRAEGDNVTPDDVAGVVTIDGVGDLVTGFRAAGLDVQLETEGEPRGLPDHVSTAAYRIVQEALTNAAKHACGNAASVGLRWSSASLEIHVVNAVEPGAAPGPGTGHGLVGMAERADAAGGVLSAARVGDTFDVRAVLPVTRKGES